MLLRSLCALPLSLALLVLLAPAASAVPCRGESCKMKVRVGRGDSSPPPSLQWNLSRPGEQPRFAVWRMLFDGGLSPGLSDRVQLPPGLQAAIDLAPRVPKRRSPSPPADLAPRVPNQHFPSPPVDPALDPPSESAVVVPEPTALVLFASGLLVARVAVRRGAAGRRPRLLASPPEGEPGLPASRE